MIKRRLSLLIVVVTMLCTLFIALPASTSAATYDPFGKVCDSSVPTSGPDASTVCVEKQSDTNPLTGKDGILIRAARFITLLTGIASIIIVLYGGMKYLTAGGDSNSVNSAKSTILYAFVGLVMSLLSQGIIVFIINSVN
jgi:hypothetical protein